MLEAPRGTPAGPGALVTVSDLVVTYRGATHPALGPISLDVREGEFVTVVGASGCGKTSLLNCVGGHLIPTSGIVTIGGVVVDRPLPQIGTVFQKANLFPWLNVLDNVVFGPKMRGVGVDERRRTGQRLLELVGLPDVARMRTYELSGGMQQRVALARSLASSPRLLLMDEPLGSLDAITRERMQVEIYQLRHLMNTTIIFVTHDIDEAIVLGDRVVVLGGSPGSVQDVIDVSGIRTKDPGVDVASAEAWLVARARILATINRTQ